MEHRLFYINVCCIGDLFRQVFVNWAVVFDEGAHIEIIIVNLGKLQSVYLLDIQIVKSFQFLIVALLGGLKDVQDPSIVGHENQAVIPDLEAPDVPVRSEGDVSLIRIQVEADELVVVVEVGVLEVRFFPTIRSSMSLVVKLFWRQIQNKILTIRMHLMVRIVPVLVLGHELEFARLEVIGPITDITFLLLLFRAFCET